MKVLNLKSSRCYLSNVRSEDFNDLQSLYSNHNVRKFLGGPVKPQDFLEKFQVMINTPCLHQWVARLTENSKFVGLFSLDMHHDGEDIELSYQVAEDMQGLGLAQEINKTLITFAFDELDLKKLISETQTANKASIKLLEKINMKLERTLQRFGTSQSVYAIYANNWNK